MNLDDDHATYADAGRQKAHQEAVCRRLGLDPTQTTDLAIEIVPGTGVVVRWSGVRRLPVEDVVDLLRPADE